MNKDKWYSLINEPLEDIPSCVEKLKSAFFWKIIPFLLLTVVGCGMIGFGSPHGIVVLGCFLAVSGVVGMLALATMCHVQLCLYRVIKELQSAGSK